MDLKLLEEQGYEPQDVIDFFSEKFDIVGLIEEKNEKGYFLYRGPGFNTDLANIATLVVDYLMTLDWFKPSCKKLNLLYDFSKDGTFYTDSFIKTWEEAGLW